MKNRTKYRKEWGWTLLIALLLALFVRTFFVASFRISSNAMEDQLMAGDYLFTSRLSSGLRLPITPLSIPFTGDTIPFTSLKSYSTTWQIPYIRLGRLSIQTNELVLFNIPTNIRNIPIDMRPLEVSRCVGMPGDTIVQFYSPYSGIAKINGTRPVEPVTAKQFYAFPMIEASAVQSAVEATKIKQPPFYYSERDSLGFCLLNNLDYFQLQTELDSLNLDAQYETQDSFRFILPKRGFTISFTDTLAHFYLSLIEAYEPVSIAIKEKAIFMNGGQITQYTFAYDYYWMLSDNRATCTDSRKFGVVPETHIIGYVNYVWFSLDSSAEWFKPFRINRFCLSVK